MKKVKIKLTNEEFKTVFMVLGDLINKEIFPIERIILKEVAGFIYEKNHKQIIKISLFESQAYILYKMLNLSNSLYIDEPGMNVIINMTKEQIETQLFKKSESGFDLLKQL